MRRPETLRVERHFTAASKKSAQSLKDKDKAWQELERKTARLKALRLAKEASGKEAAGLAAAGTAAGPKTAKRAAKAKT